jgi:hypothetical protein
MDTPSNALSIYIANLVDEAPALTAEQRSKLAIQLRS